MILLKIYLIGCLISFTLLATFVAAVYWNQRNLLHVVGGFLMGAFLSWLFAWYVSLMVIITFANYWEFCQKKHFGAKYSISDIILTTLGGVLAIGLVQILK